MTTSRSCFTVDEVAEILSVSGNTVRRLLRDAEEKYRLTGEWPKRALRGGKMGDGESPKAPWRIQYEDLNDFMKSRNMSGLGSLGPPPERPSPRLITTTT